MKSLFSLLLGWFVSFPSFADSAKPIDEIREMFEIAKINEQCQRRISAIESGGFNLNLSASNQSLNFEVTPEAGEWVVDRYFQSGVPYWRYVEKIVKAQSIRSVQFLVDEASGRAETLDLIETDIAGKTVASLVCGLSEPMIP